MKHNILRLLLCILAHAGIYTADIEISPYHPSGDLGKSGVLAEKCYVGARELVVALGNNKTLKIYCGQNRFGVAEFKIVGKMDTDQELLVLKCLRAWAIREKVMAYSLDVYAKRTEKDLGNSNYEYVYEDKYRSYFSRLDL